MKIALCGFLGSGCTEVAEILAGEFGLETYNTSRILKSIRNLDSLSRSGEIDIDEILKNKLEGRRKMDNIIVEGRSAFMVLNRRDVIKIFLNCSSENRAKHVAERRGISIEDAKDDIRRSDEDRSQMFKRLFGKDCTDISNYDFTLNTNTKTYSKIAKIIADIVKSL
ncbi:MAG: cytidylate kinase family protein [Candidatus Bathyarchaeia archaeon]